MATLEKRNERYRVVFCYYGGRKFQRSLQTTSEKAANAWAVQNPSRTLKLFMPFLFR
jgi:hypothetical protein